MLGWVGKDGKKKEAALEELGAENREECEEGV